MPTPPLHPVTIRSAQLAAARQVRLELEVPSNVQKSHRIGGQYAFFQPHDDAKANPIALANVPGAEHITVLMKVADEHVESTLALQGQQAMMSEAAGPGYDLGLAEGRHLLLCAVGSAIAPIRSALLSALVDASRFESITLVYGARDAADFAFNDDIDAAERTGVNVMKTLTKPPEDWAHRSGRVQAHLADAVKHPDATTAFVCGMSAMQNEVKAALTAQGVDADRIRFNF